MRLQVAAPSCRLGPGWPGGRSDRGEAEGSWPPTRWRAGPQPGLFSAGGRPGSSAFPEPSTCLPRGRDGISHLARGGPSWKNQPRRISSVFFFFLVVISVGLGFLVCFNRFPWEVGAGETHTYFSTAPRIRGGKNNSLRRKPVEGRLTFDHISVGLFSTYVKEVGLSGLVP